MSIIKETLSQYTKSQASSLKFPFPLSNVVSFPTFEEDKIMTTFNAVEALYPEKRAEFLMRFPVSYGVGVGDAANEEDVAMNDDYSQQYTQVQAQLGLGVDSMSQEEMVDILNMIVDEGDEKDIESASDVDSHDEFFTGKEREPASGLYVSSQASPDLISEQTPVSQRLHLFSQHGDSSGGSRSPTRSSLSNSFHAKSQQTPVSQGLQTAFHPSPQTPTSIRTSDKFQFLPKHTASPTRLTQPSQLSMMSLDNSSNSSSDEEDDVGDLLEAMENELEEQKRESREYISQLDGADDSDRDMSMDEVCIRRRNV